MDNLTERLKEQDLLIMYSQSDHAGQSLSSYHQAVAMMRNSAHGTMTPMMTSLMPPMSM